MHGAAIIKVQIYEWPIAGARHCRRTDRGGLLGVCPDKGAAPSEGFPSRFRNRSPPIGPEPRTRSGAAL